MMFEDRQDAGRRLADGLSRYGGEDPLVLGLPRGGVPVAFEVARALRAPLDVVIDTLPGPAAELLARGEAQEVPSIGTRIAQHVEEILASRCRWLEAKDVLNTLSSAELKRRLRRRSPMRAAS